MYSDASDDFTSTSHIYRTPTDVRSNRRMLPRRRDMVGKPVDGKIAIGAHFDGPLIESFTRACGDRKTSGGVSSRIERTKFPPDCSYCLTDKRPNILRHPPPRSLSCYRLWIEESNEDNDSYCQKPWKMFYVKRSNNDNEKGCLRYRLWDPDGKVVDLLSRLVATLREEFGEKSFAEERKRGWIKSPRYQPGCGSAPVLAQNKGSIGDADDVGSRYDHAVSGNTYQNLTTKSLPRRWMVLPKERDEVIA